MSKKRSLKRWLLWGFAALLLAATVFALRPKPLPADFASATRGGLEVTVDEEGETRVRDRFVVSAPLAGRVLRIELEPGDSVIADETVLAVFQPTAPTLLDARSKAEARARAKAAEAALGLAEADRDRAAAELRFAQSELERQTKLASEEIISRDTLESFELRVDTLREAQRASEFAVRSRRYDLEVARASLLENGSEQGGNATEPITLRSPIDGVILRRLRESEAIVPAGDPLLEVADPAQLEIVSDLLSTDAVKVKAGQLVHIEQWGGSESLNGRVRRVEPSGFTKISALGVEEQRVNVVIDFEDAREAWEALGDGYRVEVRIVVWQRDEALKIPTSSLFRQGEQWAVFKVEAEVAQLTTVEIGQRNGLEAEVISGLQEGDQIIIHPGDTITDGAKVVERQVH